MKTNGCVARTVGCLVSGVMLLQLLSPMSTATSLQVVSRGTNVVLSWPLGAEGYSLQFLGALASTSVWQSFSGPSEVMDEERVVTLPATNHTQFFRLVAASPSAPALLNPVSPAVVPLTSTSLVTIGYADPDADITSMDVVLSNALGTTTHTVSAALLKLKGTTGQLSLPLPAREFPFGTNAITLRLRDGGGRSSAPVELAFSVVGEGSGGTAPSLVGFGPKVDLWNLPGGASDRLEPGFLLNYADPEGDIERVRVEIIDPLGQRSGREYSAAALGLTGASGTVTRALRSFRNSDPMGTYTFTATLIDRRGNLSGPLQAFLTLFNQGGAEAPRVTGFSPGEGPAGTAVVLTGAGFDAVNPSANRVTLHGRPAVVTEAASNRLAVVVPTGAGSGRFMVRNGNGFAASPGAFNVPVAVTLEPRWADVVVNGRQQFEAALVSVPDFALTWSVNGIAGGNATLGTISPTGLYTAPGDVPTNGVLTVSARLAARSNVVGQATVRVLPPPLTPGSATVLSSSGGTVRSIDGRTRVAIPRNALPGDTRITLETLSDPERVVPGFQVLGGASFRPDGLNFREPVSITLPLATSQPPGTQLPVRWLDPANQLLVDEGILGTVTENGESVVASVSHFSSWFVLAPAFAPPAAQAPIIGGLTPIGGEEGMKVPVLVTGAGLTADCQARVLLGGNPSGDILLGTLHPQTNQAGVVLMIQTIAGLREGESRAYTLRITNSAGYADASFTVYGLNEFIVESDQNGPSSRALGPADNRRYSRVEVKGPDLARGPQHTGGVVTMAGLNRPDFMDFECTGPVIIDGRILAAGTDGGSASGLAGGRFPGTTESFGGDGGMGVDGSVFLAFGHDGNLVQALAGDLLGKGGAPGESLDFDAVGAILDIISCVTGGNITSCVSAVVEVVELVDAAQDFAAGTPFGQPGAHGYSALLSDPSDPAGFGHGGGGGGGSGEIDFFWPAPDIEGGGGGAGGGGGRPVRIASAGEIIVNGEINSGGGDGGAGAVGETFSLPSFLGLPDWEIAFSGGGGGGGSGGRLSLISAAGLHRGAGSHISAAGGRRGESGILATDTATGSTSRLANRRQGDRARGELLLTEPLGIRAGTPHQAYAPVFIPTAVAASWQPDFDFDTRFLEVETMVTTRAMVRAHWNTGTSPLLQVVNNGVTSTALGRPEPRGLFFTATLVLSNGFNTVSVGPYSSSLLPMHPLLRKTILVMAGPDRDVDGLPDSDEAVLGTDPLRPDTDGDGSSDRQEVFAGTDPLEADTDRDGLQDGPEAARGSNPLLPDTDGDGLWDSGEVVLGFDPLSPNPVPRGVRNGILFASSAGPDGAFRLTVIDPATGASGLLHGESTVHPFGLAFDAAPLLYLAQGTNLASYNPASGLTTRIGNFRGTNIASLTYCPTNDYLYGIEAGPGPGLVASGQLVRVEQSNAVPVRVGVPGGAVRHSLLFTRDGALFAAVGDTPGSDRLVRLNPASGEVAQDIGPIGFAPVNGLAVTAAGSVFGSVVVSNHVSRLLSIDLATGAGRPVATVERAVHGLALPSFRGLSGMVSRNAYNTGPGNRESRDPVVSADGRYVVFTSWATDLSPLPSDLDLNQAPDLYVRDLENGITKLITINATKTGAAGVPPLPYSADFRASVSADGRYIAFASPATNLVLGGTPYGVHVYRHDQVTRNTELVSTLPGREFNQSFLPAMTPDGRWIAFVQEARGYEVWVRDMGGPTFLPVSVNLAGVMSGVSLSSAGPVISSSGRHVLFHSPATDLATAPDSPGTVDLFLRDLQSGTTRLISIDRTGSAAGSNEREPPAMTDDGRYIVFSTIQPNMTQLADANAANDVFRRDTGAGVTVLVSQAETGLAAPSGPGGFGLSDSVGPSISADGRHVAFLSFATNLTAFPGIADVYVRDLQTDTTTMVSVNRTNTARANGHCHYPAIISPDGRRVLFHSDATDLVPGFDNYPGGGHLELFVRDLTGGGTTLVSLNSRGSAGLGVVVTSIAVSTNGVVAFSSGYGWGVNVYFRRLPP